MQRLLLALAFALSVTALHAANISGQAGVREGVGPRGAVPNPELGLGGQVAYEVDLNEGTVRLKAETIQNNRSIGVSGPLRLRLFASTVPFDPDAIIYGFFLGEATLGTLAAGARISDTDQTGPYASPPDGAYYITLFLEEIHGQEAFYYDYFEFSGQLILADGTVVATGAPFFSEGLDTFSGKALAPFSYVFTVDGALDITVSADGLPDGLFLDHTTVSIDNVESFYISGKPKKSGVFNVALNAENASGPTLKNVIFNIADSKTDAPPNILSASVAPNPAKPGEIAAFTAYATDPENSSIAYAWDFKDGTNATGSSVSHAFTAAGTYNVALSVFDGTNTVNQTVTLVVAGPANMYPTIGVLAASKNPAAIGQSIAFSSTAVDPRNLALTYSWNFGDGSPAAPGQNVTHSFAKNGTFSVTLTVINSAGFSTTRSDLKLYVYSGAGDPGINPGNGNDSPEGLRIDVLSSENGVMQFGVTVTSAKGLALRASNFDFFSDLSVLGRNGVAKLGGDKPIGVFLHAGTSVLTSAVREKGTSVFIRGRKTVALSSRETGDPEDVPDTLSKAQKLLKASKLAGKFNFADDAMDTVDFSCAIPLPAGLDTKKPHELSAAIGNVIDRILLAEPGKFTAASDLGLIKKLSLKYPKTDNGKTTAGQFGKIELQFSAPNLDTAGFESDGVSANAAKAGKTSATIQIALVFAGIPYMGTAEVSFKSDKKIKSGAIKLKR